MGERTRRCAVAAGRRQVVPAAGRQLGSFQHPAVAGQRPALPLPDDPARGDLHLGLRDGRAHPTVRCGCRKTAGSAGRWPAPWILPAPCACRPAAGTTLARRPRTRGTFTSFFVMGERTRRCAVAAGRRQVVPAAGRHPGSFQHPAVAGHRPALPLPDDPARGAVCSHWMVMTLTSVFVQAWSRHWPLNHTWPLPIITPCWLTNTLPKSCSDTALTTSGVMIFS